MFEMCGSDIRARGRCAVVSFQVRRGGACKVCWAKMGVGRVLCSAFLAGLTLPSRGSAEVMGQAGECEDPTACGLSGGDQSVLRLDEGDGAGGVFWRVFIPGGIWISRASC